MPDNHKQVSTRIRNTRLFVCVAPCRCIAPKRHDGFPHAKKNGTIWIAGAEGSGGCKVGGLKVRGCDDGYG